MRQRSVIVALVVLTLLTAGISAQVVLAQTGTTTTGAPAYGAGTPAAAGATSGTNTNVVTLGPGQSASIPANFWCLDFGKAFPTGLTGPSGEAPAKVESVLQAAKSQGTVNSDPYQTQLAVWYAATGAWHDTGKAGHALAQQLVNAANSAGSATATPTHQSLGALMGSGGLTVNVQNFQAVPDKAGVATYHGTGNIVVYNASNQAVNFVLDGAVFQPTNYGAQTLFAQTANTPQVMGTATSAAAATAVATSAAAAPTVAPTATTVPTTAPTVAAASTAIATVAPTATSTAVAMATPATLPTTGAGNANGWMFVLLLLGALTLFAGFGLGARRAQR